MSFDFNQNDGLVMLGLPNKTLLIAQAVSLSVGCDIATVFAKALMLLAQTELTREEQIKLAQQLR